MVYLIKSEARNGSYYKIGYTSNMNRRILAYITHNANAQLLETVQTYKCTKHQLEKALHSEIIAKGYEFKTTTIQAFGIAIRTEWFFVDIAHEAEFEASGLKQFKACKNRSIARL